MKTYFLAVALLALACPAGGIAEGLERGISVPATGSDLDIARVRYQGRTAVRIRSPHGGHCCVIPLPGPALHDGEIEALVAGRPIAGASATARGFIGIAFRVQGGDRYEAFYIRPTNGRAPDQLRRNHATQYISAPDYPWERLRREAPGVYESYADLATGAWTHLRIHVEGDHAELYVNRAPQPVLIVNDLKLGAYASGGIALWVGDESEAYFSDISARPAAGRPAPPRR